MTAREALIESVRARELAALASLGAAADGRSLCSLSRSGTSVPSAKYHEGAAFALAEARRAVQAIAAGSHEEREAQLAMLEIRARRQAQSDTVGRTGPDWTSYLTGGLDALEQIVDGAGERQGALDAHH
jgi:hypothetical protein